MTTPRTVVDDTLPITRIVVTGDINTERVVVDVEDQPRIAVANTGEDITVTIATTAAGVNSVNGLQGDVTLTTSNITEGTNQYFTTARARSAISAGNNITITNGVVSTVTEPDFTSATVTEAPTDNYHVVNKAYVDMQVSAVPVINSTDDLAEGEINLYYTDARARASNSAGAGISYNPTTGVITSTITQSPITAVTDVQQVFAYATNADSVTILKGQPVYMYAATGNRVSVKLAANTGDSTSAKTMGLAYQNIAAGTPGYIITQGVLDGLNTAAYAEGDTLYLGATAGTLTKTKPHAPNHLVYIGVVERANAGNGQIYVKPQNGYELDEIHDVDLVTSTPTAGQVLRRNPANTLWVNETLDTDDIPEGSTNKYYTDARADARVAIGIASIVDTAPTTLDTLNELAAALGDDPNFATTVTTALGTKLATADFASTFDTRLATKSTTNLAEGSNLYYTDARARASNSAGTGVTYNSSTGVISIGQDVATNADVVFNSVDANITDSNYVLGQMIVTRNTSYTPPGGTLSTISGSNGLAISSSTGGVNGYTANIGIRYASGDTSAGINASAGFTTGAASGNSTSPGGNAANQVMGSWNWDGYTAGTSNGWATSIATSNSGGGINSVSPLQAQGYARQAFTNSTTVTTAVTGGSGTGSTVTLTFATQNTQPYQPGQTVTISGMTPSGFNGTYVLSAATTSSISYANTTTGNSSVNGTIAAANTVTAAGMGFRIRGFANSTNMSVYNRINFMDLTASAATFKADAYTFADSVITGSTLTQTNLMTLSSSGAVFRNAPTSAYASLGSTGTTFTAASGIHNFVRTGTVNTTQPALLVRYNRTDTANANDNDGVDFRMGVGGTSTTTNIARVDASYRANGFHQIGLSVSNDSFAADTDTVYRAQADKTVIRATPTGTTGTASDILTVESTKVTSAVPIAYPSYTTTQRDALSPAAGWVLWNSTLTKLQVWTGSAWADLH